MLKRKKVKSDGYRVKLLLHCFGKSLRRYRSFRFYILQYLLGQNLEDELSQNRLLPLQEPLKKSSEAVLSVGKQGEFLG